MATLWEIIDDGADEVCERSFFGEDLSCANLGHVEFEDCSFDGCSFAELKAARITFDRCTFESCDFSNARMATSYWRDCQFGGSRLVGCDLHHSYFVRDSLRDCACAYLNLTESKLEQVRFSGCDLHEASLAQLKLKRVTLEGCDLTRAELFGTRLRGIDLSTCEIQALRVSDTFAELRGAHIGIDQAPDLVGLLGIKLV